MSELTVVISPDRRHAAVSGDIDIANVGELDAALAKLSGEIVVDCTAVTFISSSGFASLDRRYDTALARGGTFVVCGMRSSQRRIAAILSVPYVRS